MIAHSSDNIRLNKYIASALAIGRRQVDTLIEKGSIRVNGQKPILGARVSPTDIVTVDGQPLKTAEKGFLYLALHKPVGYVCSRRQQGDTPTIYALLPKKYQHLKPVGRLDKDSSGLILLTNDGDFAHQMTHPRYTKIKRYEISIDNSLEPLHRQMISDIGVDLPDGKSRLQLDRIQENDDTRWYVTMHEGRNRQIRRTFGALGYEVINLHRTQFGNYALNSLHAGSFETIKKK